MIEQVSHLAQITMGDWGILAMISSNIDVIAILLGSILGSFKAYTLTSENLPTIVKVNNVGLGIFTGVSLAFHYIESTNIWFAAIISLISSSLAVTVIDSLFNHAPEIAVSLMEKWFNIQINPRVDVQPTRPEQIEQRFDDNHGLDGLDDIDESDDADANLIERNYHWKNPWY